MFVVQRLKRKHRVYMCIIVGLAILGIYGLVSQIEKCKMSTNPPAYPRDGIGGRVGLSDDFNSESLRTLCEDSNITAIIPINSRATNFNRRQALRESLGHACTVFNCKMFFIVGASLDNSVMDKIQSEIKSYGDILMVDMVDTYTRIANKLVTMLKWLVEFCRQPSYVMFMNDDTYINLGRFLSELEAAGGIQCNCILCNTFTFSVVKRSMNSKWFVTQEDYPCAIFPIYCGGAAYAFPNTVTPVLLKGVYEAPFVWPDDVWLTGLVRNYVNVNAVSTKSPVLLHWNYGIIDTSDFRNYLYVHNVTQQQLLQAFQYDLGKGNIDKHANRMVRL